MPQPKRIERVIRLDRIFLHHKNPRHEPYDTEAQVIDWLCRNEEVPQLARDIANHGLSPFDRFGVVRAHETDSDDASYVVVEGNRRLCALKLLDDPDLAPAGRREYFEKQAGIWTPITELPCVIFDDQADLDLWLKRRHHGFASGIGQKQWNPEQKSRHSGVGSRNRIALAFLDYAEREKLISADDRKQKLTTVQRFLSNPLMRETLGLDISDPDNLLRNRPEHAFKLLAGQFISDILGNNPRVNSRQNSTNIIAYARELDSIEGLTHERVEPESLMSGPQESTSTRGQRPGSANRPRRLPYQPEIAKELNKLGTWKLQSLYRSICKVPLQDNTPLLAVGTWAFFETLTAKAGRDPNTSFHSFLSLQLLKGYGLGTKQQINPLRDAIERILKYGNTTKHHDTAAAFNGDQLANDMESLGELILKVIDDAIAKKKK